MGVRYTDEDIFKIDVDAITNPVNCDGVSGKGLAKQFAIRYKKNQHLYESACKSGEIAPGKGLITKTGVHQPRYIVNFPTKQHWRNPSSEADIELGLRNMHKQLLKYEIPSIALPALGCGLGELPWGNVKSLIGNEFSEEHDIDVVVCYPRG